MEQKNHKLKKRKEFAYIFKHGIFLNTKILSLVYLPSKLKNFKVGFSVSKKIGKAVVRNKTKRRLKEAFRQNKMLARPQFNYIFVAKNGIENSNFEEICKNVEFLLKKVNLWKKF